MIVPLQLFVGKIAPIPYAFTQCVFRSVYVSKHTYMPPCTGLRAWKFVGDKRCWYVVNHSGPVEGGKERRIVLPPWFLFDANPVNYSLVYQRFLCCSLLFFYVFHLLLLCFVFNDRFLDLQRYFLTVWLHRVFSLLAFFSFLSPVL